MYDAVHDSQPHISPSQSNCPVILNVEESQSQHDCVELSRLFQQVVEVISGPLNKSWQLSSFLLLDNLRIEADIVLLEGGGSALVQEKFHGESPDVETNEGPEEGFVEKMRGHCGVG